MTADSFPLALLLPASYFLLPMSLVTFPIIRVCWSIFFIVWVLAAIFTKRTVQRETSARRLAYIGVAVIGWFLLFRRGSRTPSASASFPRATPFLLPPRSCVFAG